MTASMSGNLPTLIFIAGVTGRTGTNYLGRALLEHPAVARPDKHWELTLLEAGEKFRAFYDEFRRHRGSRTPFEFDEMAKALGDGLLLRMQERLIDTPDAKFILHKNPSTAGIELFHAFFPAGRLVLLVRDGRDVVNSLLSANKVTERWSLKRARLMYIYSKLWRARSQTARDYSGDALTVRYEELLRDPRGELERVRTFVGLPADPAWLERAVSIPVSGSNFFRGDGEEKAAEGTDWRKHERTENFKPVGRWQSTWTPLDRLIFQFFAGDELERWRYP